MERGIFSTESNKAVIKSAVLSYIMMMTSLKLQLWNYLSLISCMHVIIYKHYFSGLIWKISYGLSN